MRKVVVYELLSLDGVAEDPDAFIVDWDAAMGANLASVIGSQDAVVLGRRSYDEWSAFWPSSTIQPFADFINAVPKHVATSTPLTGGWSGATAIDGELVDFVRDLRAGAGDDVGVHASISVVQTLLSANLVDELRLVIAPRVGARGRRLLDGVPPMRFEVLRAAASPSGALLIDYRIGQ